MVWNAALHPRGPLGRFVPKYVPGSLRKNTHIGLGGGGYVGIKTGAEFDILGGAGGRVLTKGIVGYRPPLNGSINIPFKRKNAGKKVKR